MVFSLLALFSAFAATYMPQGDCPLQIDHKTYSLCYHPEHRQSLWAYHHVKKEDINGGTRRTNDYRRDPNIPNAVGSGDFSGSGFDRGHLVPAADRKRVRSEMSETFYMSNMTPQQPGFNRGIWQALEKHIRRLVSQKGEAVVITAPHLHPGLKKLRKNISIPEFHYKIAYWPSEQYMVAYLIPNIRPDGKPYSFYQVTVDEIEALTGLDFFASLDDEIEDLLESEKL